MKPRRKTRFQKASLQRLTRIALRCWYTEDGVKAMTELQLRGSPQTLELARNLYTSRHWRRRGLAMYIAAQLWRREGGRLVMYATEACHPLLFAGLHDPHPAVITNAVTGFAHRYHPAALDDLVRLSTHANDQVRWAVAFTLSGYTQPESIATLLHLMTDRDDEVRNYATWALGEMHEADTPQIRAALWRNVDDRDDDVRGEALDGLAQRGDTRVIPYLIAQLTPDCRVYALNAAETLADPVLLPALLALQASCSELADGKASYWKVRLRDAIAACSPPPAESARRETLS